jgi:hypothetical protein
VAVSPGGFDSEGLAADVVDRGGIFSFHIRLCSQNGWGRFIGLVREREYLDEASVESDKVFFDQLVSGFQVVIQAHLQKGTELIVAVKGKTIPVGYDNQKKIE